MSPTTTRIVREVDPAARGRRSRRTRIGCLALERLEERVCASVYYNLEVMAEPGQNDISSVSTASINDKGRIAVGATLTDASGHIFLADGLGLTDVTPVTTPQRDFGFPFLNNQNQILGTSFFIDDVGSDDVSLYRWNAGSASAATLIAHSRSFAGGPDDDPLFNSSDFFHIGFGSWPSLADDGQVAFFGVDGDISDDGPPGDLTLDLYLASSKVNRGDIGPRFASIPQDSGILVRSMVAAVGDRVLVTIVESPSTTIALHDTTGFDSSEVIASTIGGPWTSLGGFPGLSDDGAVIVFYGDRGNGPGLFASIEQSDGTRVLTKVAGENGGATKYPELGYDAAGMPLYFSSLDPTGFSKLGVVVHHLPGGDPHAVDPGESFVVSFRGTPSGASRNNPITGKPLLFSNKEGLWTTQVQARPSLVAGGATVYFTTSALPVLQIGDFVDGVAVTGLALFDPISNARADLGGLLRSEAPGDHYLAFIATSTAGTRLIRASQFDTDADGLFDHWEQQGIDIDQDGTIDLDLPGMGADPKHKDMFLEIDWLKDDNPTANIADSRTFDPQPEAIDFLVTTFANAPVNNPDGTSGITVHVDGGQFLERNMGPAPGASPLLANLQGGDTIAQAGSSNHIHVIYFGAEGSVSFPGAAPDSFGRPIVARSFESIKENYFGTTTKWARELAFRYVVFGDRHTDPTKESTGRAEITFFDPNIWEHTLPGNDYIVSLQGMLDPATLAVPSGGPPGTPATIPTPIAFHQGQTLVHELGHTLGLRHGGVDSITTNAPNWPSFNPANYKPNYRSLMNYAYQFGVAPDATLVRDYSHSGDAIFDDWSNIQLGFSRYFDNLGNTDAISKRSLGSDPPGFDRPEPGLDEIEVVHGLLETRRRTFTIELAAGTGVPVGAALRVPIRATTDTSVASAIVAFDANGDGQIDPATEHLSAVLVAPGRFEANFPTVTGPTGPRTLGVIATDPGGRTQISAFEIEVGGTTVNQPPTASGDGPVSLDEDTHIVVGVLANDGDPEGALDPASVAIVAGPAHGTVQVDASTGQVTYRPNADFHGSDTFTYTVRDAEGLASSAATVEILIRPVNDAPIAAADSYQTKPRRRLNITIPGLLDNDLDRDGDALSIQLDSAPGHGRVRLQPDGSFVYTPKGGFIGIDRFTYKASDGTISSAPATVTILVGNAPAKLPRATRLMRGRSSRQGTQLQVSFNQLLDTAASALHHYTLIDAGADHLFATGDDTVIGLAKARLNPSGRVVNLKTATRLLRARRYRLEIKDAVTSTFGIPLDGNRDGQPGAAQHLIFGRRAVSSSRSES
jgi:hypothetical protein